MIWFQGEEKTSEKDKESSTDEKKSDKAEAPPDDGLTDEVRERKRLSLAAQQVRISIDPYSFDSLTFRSPLPQ